MSNTTPTTKQEEAFHDTWAEHVDVAHIDVDLEFAGPGDPENLAAVSYLEPLEGKRILDAGCGYGVASVYFARRGARVTALDVSGGMLERVRELAARYGVSETVETLQCPLEQTALRGEKYDAVYGYGVLHHTELARALAAVKAVLKPGGKAVFIEPLGINPVVNLYRRLSPGVRTKDEQPFRRRELRAIKQVFPGSFHTEVQLTSMVVYAFLALFGGLDLNRDRLWKVLSDPRRARLAKVSAWLSALDKTLVRLCPPVGLLAWATVIVLEAERDD